MGNKSAVQVRTHAYGYFAKVYRGKAEGYIPPRTKPAASSPSPAVLTVVPAAGAATGEDVDYVRDDPESWDTVSTTSHASAQPAATEASAFASAQPTPTPPARTRKRSRAAAARARATASAAAADAEAVTEATAMRADWGAVRRETAERGGCKRKRSRRKERWTEEEHAVFLRGLEVHGRQWKRIQAMLPHKSVVQVRTHAYGYFAKLLRRVPDDEETMCVARIMLELPTLVRERAAKEEAVATAAKEQTTVSSEAAVEEDWHGDGEGASAVRQ